MQLLEGTEHDYAVWRAKNDDPYSRRCFTFAEEWAELMEQALARGERLADVANPTSRTADTDGITGFMFGMAVAILAKHWVHGEELRRWHNRDTQIHDEGDKANEQPGAVLNPALLTITPQGDNH